MSHHNIMSGMMISLKLLEKRSQTLTSGQLETYKWFYKDAIKKRFHARGRLALPACEGGTILTPK